VTKHVRAELHERFADWLEATLEARADEYEEIIGHHLEQAHGYVVELAPADERASVLAGRAGRRLGRAGRRAFARGDVAAAANLLERALAALGAADPARGELMLDLARAHRRAGDGARALREAAEA